MSGTIVLFQVDKLPLDTIFMIYNENYNCVLYHSSLDRLRFSLVALSYLSPMFDEHLHNSDVAVDDSLMKGSGSIFISVLQTLYTI